MRLKFYVSAILLCFSLFLTGIAVAQPNIASGRNAYSSSNESGSYLPGNVTDENFSTRWASVTSDNQWIYVDLLQRYDLSEVRLYWETALGRDFNIEVSSDAITWVTAQVISGNTNFSNIIDMQGYAGRYVRMNGLVRGTEWGFSLYEFEIYGTLATGAPVNLAVSKTGSSSSNENGTYTPDYAFDGEGQDTNDGAPNDGKAHNGSGGPEYGRWSSTFNDDEWISVDLGAVYAITEVKLFWEVANGNDYYIEVSTDNTTWTTRAIVYNNPAGQFSNVIPIGSAPARYVRMHGITRNLTYGYSLYEFEVYGPNAILPITLSDFTAIKRDKAVKLSWNASMDAESRFNIQRSANGADFTTIGKLYYPTGTNGISNSYGYLDESPLAGINYYRLEYTETGEKTLYSDVLSVRFAEKRSFNVSPNPVTGNTIRVELDKTSQTKRTLRLLTITGKIIEQQEINANSSVADLQLNRQVSAGTYILQVLDGDQPVRSRKIIINR